jgi:hypothetical protein
VAESLIIPPLAIGGADRAGMIGEAPDVKSPNRRNGKSGAARRRLSDRPVARA